MHMHRTCTRSISFIRTHKNKNSLYKFVCSLFTRELWVSVRADSAFSPYKSLHFSLPLYFPTPNTNNTTTLLPITTNKEPTYLEYLIDTILNIVSLPT